MQSEKSILAAILDAKKATIGEEFCEVSQFANEVWATSNGCWNYYKSNRNRITTFFSSEISIK